MKELKKLIVDIDKDIHKYIKHRAIEMNITLKDWVMLAIFKQIEEEKKYQ